jgi:glycosyltransferase involved in cell wall biosynthesis
VRVLVISDLYPPVACGGYELECASLVERLRRRHDVVVLTSTLDRRRAPPDSRVRRDLPVVPRGRVRAALLAPVASAIAARRTRRALGAARPDLVYVSNGAAIPQVAIVVAAAAGVPVVCRFSERWYAASFLVGDRFLRHLVRRERLLLRPWGALVRAANRLPGLRVELRPVRAAISWNSAALRRDVGPPPMVVPRLERVIHPGPARHAPLAAQARRPAGERTVAYVGRVTTAKGAKVAMRALAFLSLRHRVHARLVYAGACRPAMRRTLERLARDLGVDDRVAVLGPLDGPALGDLLARAHAVVVPTVEHEAFGTAAVEAALARAPVVASDLGGLPEALPDGCAALFPPGDAEVCADALAATLRDAAATRLRVERAYTRALTLTPEAYLDASEQLIADAC